MGKDTLKIMSYNSTGMASDKKEFIKTMLNEYEPDIMFIQELWLVNAVRNNILRNLSDHYMADGVSAVCDDKLLIGRPYGGLGILWKKTMIESVVFKEIPNTKRACAAEVKYDSDKLLLINMYLPVDNQRKTHVDAEFMETIDCIEMFLENTPYQKCF